ncbi:MAG: trypsin-like serine protease [Cyanobacteriota bacterium]|nr:trypsin-like serine protease [Cyanobacteriota bacterium]
MPAYSGVATLLITKGTQGSFICSGSLLDDRRSILTAAHCISDNLGNLNATSASAFFYDGSLAPPYNPDTVVWTSPAATSVSVSNYFIAPGYSGAVIENDDVAVLRLASEAPSFANSYGLYLNNLMSTQFNVAGYGLRSNVGGNAGANQASGILRQGNNRYEFQWSDPNFNSAFTTDPNFINGANTWAADFDNGLTTNDAGCLIAKAVNPSLANNPTYCNLGVGAKESAIASGDSGSPGFVNDQIASISSYALTFGPTYGDINSTLNFSFGEFSGYVPVSSHVAFIESVKVPGPLPILGAATMVSWSRRLRRRISISGRVQTGA